MVEFDMKFADRVLELVDQGLTEGIGSPEPGSMCVMAAVSYAMGTQFTDKVPECVDADVNSVSIRLNDGLPWGGSSYRNHFPPAKSFRAAGMRRLAIAQIGSAGVIDPDEFNRRVLPVWADYTTTCNHMLSLPADQALKIGAAYVERFVDILKELGSPGCEFLCLTEAPKEAA